MVTTFVLWFGWWPPEHASCLLERGWMRRDRCCSETPVSGVASMYQELAEERCHNWVLVLLLLLVVLQCFRLRPAFP